MDDKRAEVLSAILEGARETASRHAADIRPLATLTLFDALITATLGHTHPVVRDICREFAPGTAGASILSIPSRSLEPRDAAYCNALGLCWYELDPGFRHAGCHATLHILPTLLALAEKQNRSVGWLIEAFAYCYEALTRIAMTWSTPRSGLHSHAVLAPIGAALAQCIAHERDVEFSVRVLNIAATTINLGLASEVKQGGEARNLWPALAAANSFALYAAGVNGVATNSRRFTELFDQTFGRRSENLASRFDGPSITQDYKKLFPCCRHLHSAIEAALSIASTHSAMAGIKQVRVDVHPEAAALDGRRPINLLAAQFSLPVCVAIALVTGQFDLPTLVTRHADAAVLEIADRIDIAHWQGGRYPNDRGARVAVTCVDGRSLDAVATKATGEPGGPSDELIRNRKVALVANSFPETERARWLTIQATLDAALHRPEVLVRDALAILG